MEIGTERVSSQQQTMLERLRGRPRPEEFLRYFSQLFDDDDIAQGREQVHPDWLLHFERYKDQIRGLLGASHFQRITSFIERLAPFDEAVGELDPRRLKLSFLLGAGASKPAPSNIPTVKELLRQLLERARRLDREDVTKLADFWGMPGRS